MKIYIPMTMKEKEESEGNTRKKRYRKTPIPII